MAIPSEDHMAELCATDPRVYYFKRLQCCVIATQLALLLFKHPEICRKMRLNEGVINYGMCAFMTQGSGAAQIDDKLQ